MYVIAIDDVPLSSLGIDPALLTSESDDLAFSVRRREGATTSAFFGGAPEPAVWSVLFRPPDPDARAALLAMLTSRLDEERRLVAVRDDAARTLVTARAAIYHILRKNALDVLVELEGIDSVWTEEALSWTRKAFASSRDQAMAVRVPGSTETAPSFRLTPLAQRTSGTAAVGSRYRVRYEITNLADEPLWRYPLRIDLGSTTALVSASKALASGNDVRLWIDGIEHPRTLLGWNTATSSLWMIVPVLLPDATLTVEVVYGNLAADAPPVLAYPDLPPFTLSSSSNALWDYPVSPIAANGGLGIWYLSKGTEGANADFTVPGAWRPLATLGNPDNEDAVAQLRASQYTASGIKYQAILDTLRGPTESTVVLASNPFDGIGIHHPLGIVSLHCDFRWLNLNAVAAIVILARDSAAEGWERLITSTDPHNTELAVPAATYAPGAPVKHLAVAVWPNNLVAVPEAQLVTDYARLRCGNVFRIAIDASKVQIAPVDIAAHPWTPSDLGGSLRGWFSAANIGGVADGGAVALWPDASGASAHATQGTVAAQPAYRAAHLNGLPGVEFSGSQRLLSALTSSELSETVVAVIRLDAVATVAHLLSGSDANGRDWQLTTGRLQRFARTGVLATSTAAVPLATAAIVAGTLAHPTSTFALAGVTESVATAGQSAPANLTSILGDAVDGVIYEVVSAGPQSAANLDRLVGYLAHRYGLTGSLAGGHPYKSAAPQVAGSSEVEIYELATELRFRGGSARVAPYRALRIGNAREESGAGTPRCAIALNQSLIIDGELRTHGVWPAALTTRVEDVSAHAVQGVTSWEADGATVEGFTSEWIPLPPNLPHLPQSSFDTGSDGWVLESASAGMTTAVGHTIALGGDVLGALSIAVTPNSAGINARAVVLAPRILPVAGREAVGLAAWVSSTTPNLAPLLFLRFLDADGALVSDVVEAVWVPLAGEGVRRAVAARVPERAASWRYGVIAHGVTAGVLGSMSLDDVRPNAVDLLVSDIAIGSLDVAVGVRGRWLW